MIDCLKVSAKTRKQACCRARVCVYTSTPLSPQQNLDNHVKFITENILRSMCRCVDVALHTANCFALPQNGKKKKGGKNEWKLIKEFPSSRSMYAHFISFSRGWGINITEQKQR